MDCVRNEHDFHSSMEKALSEIDHGWKRLPGVIVFGTHRFTHVEEKLNLIRKARERGLPFLGECGGLHLAVIEYARNVLGLKDADSTEMKPNCAEPVVIKNHDGLRVGIRKVGDRYESYWHNYQVNPVYGWKDWNIVTDQEGVIAEMRLRGHPFFVGTQYHPSYGSSKDKPHPLLISFIEACRNAASRHH